MADAIERVRDFLVELKRRKVYHVAVIYIVVAAGALQLVDAVVPSTRLPGWSDEFFLGLVVLGFPLALVLAWALEMTPEGVRRTSAAPSGDIDRDAEAPSGAGSAPAGTTDARPVTDDVGSGQKETDAVALDLNPSSVAVLPFDNLSGTDEAELLAAGLHDDLLTQLSKVSGLTVISRTSVKRYRESGQSVPEIARELDVGTMLEGGVQSAGGRVRLNVQLIDTRHDVHRWAETYDRELSAENIFEIQSELARKIAATLRATLSPDEEERLDQQPTEDLDAYRLHAQGRAQLDRRTEEGFRRALDLFQGAIERDTTYALAWVGLADTLTLLHDYGYEAAEEVLPPAEEAVRHALDLDPNSAEAHASLGLLHSVRREGPAAIQELERAVELRPGYAEAHNWSSWVSCLLGNSEQALESARRAVELNPLSPEAVANLSLSHLVSGDYEAALAEARRVCELEPSWTSGPFYEALALYQLGRYMDAVSALRDLTVRWAGAGAPATLALAHIASGEGARARELLARIEEEGDRFAVGLIHVALGEVEDAFRSFQRAELSRHWPTLSVRHLYSDVWNMIRDDPRYPGLLRRVERSWGLETDGSSRGGC